MNAILVTVIGGVLVGSILLLAKWLPLAYREWRDKRNIYNWLSKEVSQDIQEFRCAGISTVEYYACRNVEEISNATNLPIDRVKKVCSIHKRIVSEKNGKLEAWTTRGWEKR